MTAEGRKIRTGDVLYMLALGLYLFRSLVGSTFFGVWISDRGSNGICLAAIFLLFFHEILYERYLAKTWVGLILAILFCAIVLRVDYLPFACMILLLYGGRNMDLRQIARFVLAFLTIFMVVVIASALAGVITNYTRIETTRNNREYLGFLYALYPSGYLLHIVLLCFYLYQKKTSVLLLAVLGLASWWIYSRTDSRMSFLLSLLVIALALLLRCFPGIPEKLGKWNLLHLLVYPAAAAGTLYVTLRYNLSVGWMSRLNTLLAQRLIYQQKSYQQYGISLFGREIHWVGNGLNANGVASSHLVLYVDNIFLQFLQKYGIVMSVLVLACIVTAQWKLYRKKQYVLLLILTLIALDGLINDSVLYLNYNIFWLAVSMADFGTREADRKTRRFVERPGS